MSQPAEAHEESEVVMDMSRVLRTAGMAGMQMSEAVQRRRQHRERMDQARDAEISRMTESAAGSVSRNAHSRQFWDHAGNRAIADNVLTAQQLGAQGNTQANNAYMMMADTIRDRYGLSVEPLISASSTPEDVYQRLRQGLDDHNAKGRELDALSDDHQQQLDNARAAAGVEAELYEAAVPEANAVGIPVADYLRHIGEDGQASLLEDVRAGHDANEALDHGSKAERRTARDALENLHSNREERLEHVSARSAAEEELRQAAHVEARMANTDVDLYLEALTDTQRSELLEAHRHPSSADEARDLETQRRADRVTTVVTNEAAAAEARAHGVPTDQYLEALTDQQRDEMIRDRQNNDTSPEATQRLEDRMEAVNTYRENQDHRPTLAEARAATTPEAQREAGAEREHERDQTEEAETQVESESRPSSEAKAARAAEADGIEDVSRDNERLAERQEADQFSAERRKADVATDAHDVALERHLDKATRTDPQAGEALRQARETTPRGGRDHLQRSTNAKVTPSKAQGNKSEAAREQVRTR